MTKKLYRIPIEWAVTGIMLVEAESLADALIEAEDAPLPEAQDYLEGTFQINRSFIPYVNKNLTEAEIKDECYETI